jgi:simple sugar transport system permease protein
MALSGAIAGCGGIFQIMAINTRLIDGFSNGSGFDGVAVSALAGGNVIGVFFSGILFGAFKNGAMVVQRISHVPSDIVRILQSLVIIFVAAPEMMIPLRNLLRNLFSAPKKEKVN